MDPFASGPTRTLSSPPESPARRSPRVLLLTEDEAQASELTTGLRLEGLPILHVATLSAFQSAWDTFRPEILLISAPAEGYEPLPFAQDLALHDVDFVFLTQEAPSYEEELAALDLGALGVLTAPILAHELAQLVRTRAPRTHHVFTSLPEGAIAGNLATHPPQVLAAMISRHHANARLHIEHQGDWSVLLLRHGQLIDAESPQKTGRAAAEDILSVQEGAFVLVPMGEADETLLRHDVIKAPLSELVQPVKPVRRITTHELQKRPKTTSELPHLGSPRAPMPAGDTLEFSPHDIKSGAAQRAHTMLSAPAVSFRQTQDHAQPRIQPRVEVSPLRSPTGPVFLDSASPSAMPGGAVVVRPPSGPVSTSPPKGLSLASEDISRDQRSIFESLSEPNAVPLVRPKADLDLSQARRLPMPPPLEQPRPLWPWLLGLALVIGLALLLMSL